MLGQLERPWMPSELTQQDGLWRIGGDERGQIGYHPPIRIWINFSPQ